MAHRQAPQAPSKEPQKRAFYRATRGRHWRGLRGKLVSGPRAQRNSTRRTKGQWPALYQELRWAIGQEIAALQEEAQSKGRRREGTPAKLARLIRASVWLEHHGGIGLSDAPNSRCVRGLRRLLEWEGAAHPAPRSTAEQLAGTLLAYASELNLL
jgi:hypothetical protein